MMRLTRVREEAAVGDNGKVIQHMRIEYMIGDHGPFTELVPKQPNWDMEARRRMEERARELHTLTGM